MTPQKPKKPATTAFSQLNFTGSSSYGNPYGGNPYGGNPYGNYGNTYGNPYGNSYGNPYGLGAQQKVGREVSMHWWKFFWETFSRINVWHIYPQVVDFMVNQ